MQKYLCILALSLMAFSGAAQTGDRALAVNSNVQIDVLAVYEDVVAQGYHSAQVYRKLANGRYLEQKFDEAKKWYSKLFEMDEAPETIEYLRYAETLEALEEFDLAQTYKAQYDQLKDQD
ncbi:hypothetical protein [Gilvibacter sp.]|uniref:hypothetical protein n=1 Tax=Gilvibacter sp. TaxID=2729997 RepID=UPI0025C281FD|nr:hypothetical protein [Gilvibacter sp.]NQX76803.1 hypothetical protein [Gilvibacter sp.]